MAVYACSDLHGDGRLWKAIKEFLQPEDTLYCLGDVTDRGTDGWLILKDMLNDPRVIYIVGNHDIMLAERISHPKNASTINTHYINGGFSTWKDAEIDEDRYAIRDQLRQLPFYTIYTNTNGLQIFMSHSGSTDIEDVEDLIWNRSSYVTSHNFTPYDVIVHGHTPAPYLENDLISVARFNGQKPSEVVPHWEGGAYWYKPFRCDIDCATAQTGQTVLLNLDTFDEEIFEV